MVKNDKGGHHKNRARKDNTPSVSYNKLRVVEEEGEIYAVVVKMLGGGMCHAECIDGKKRLCHFRGKFSGKNKRQNEISMNTWIMVGVREWEADKPVATSGKKEQLNQCDLLEVYSDHQKKQLIAMPREEWHILTNHDTSIDLDHDKVEGIAFKTESAQEYDELMDQFLKNGVATSALGAEDTLEQRMIDVADI
jgi:initiation factor 1A